ncbi:biopolymer transporter ExbD [Candidatus Aminicenantes bacterium AC-334-K16]|jgi:biopolymer transport protein TolR|nr:biopolymer transporter ExbD [Candidatus Aminicenantes bacterium AC-334-K16]HHF43100.1 biopolymer transporter ExbD [Candidatus Aminicenantes bacterium]
MAKAEPNVVPLCDVLLVLLIIFMVITPMVQKGIDVKLPETTQDTSATPQGLIVLTLKKDLSVLINQEAIQLNMLQDRLRSIYQARSDKTIFIRADAKLPFSRVIDIIDIAKGAGVEVLGIIPEYFTEEE